MRRSIDAGKTYEKDGALWLATTAYADLGDDKDRVMRKSDGTYTYFVPDVAYHLAKWERGYRQGDQRPGQRPPRHGRARARRACAPSPTREHLGLPAIYPDYVLHKMVRVMRGGEEVKISKRAGGYVTLRDLITMSGGGDEPNVRGRDAVRFFFITRKADTEFTFDVDLALQQSDENPVYYVQYAHARICSVLARWGGPDWERNVATLADADLSPLVAPREIALMQRLAEYPRDAGRRGRRDGAASARVLAQGLRGRPAQLLQCRARPGRRRGPARRAGRAARRDPPVIANGLAIAGVSAPQKM